MKADASSASAPPRPPAAGCRASGGTRCRPPPWRGPRRAAARSSPAGRWSGTGRAAGAPWWRGSRASAAARHRAPAAPPCRAPATSACPATGWRGRRRRLPESDRQRCQRQRRHHHADPEDHAAGARIAERAEPQSGACPGDAERDRQPEAGSKELAGAHGASSSSGPAPRPASWPPRSAARRASRSRRCRDRRAPGRTSSAPRRRTGSFTRLREGVVQRLHDLGVHALGAGHAVGRVGDQLDAELLAGSARRASSWCARRPR